MARIFTDGLEHNSLTVTANGWDTAAGGSISTTTIRTGTYSLAISGLVSATAQGLMKKWLSVSGTGPYYLRTYLNISALPSANNTIITFAASSTMNTSVKASIALTSSGTLILQDTANAQVGSASSALSLNTWYMVELKTDATPASGSRVYEARLEGVVFATSSTGAQANSLAFGIGGNMLNEAQTTGSWFFDDVALNDSAAGGTQTSYPGSGKVIRLFPNAAGDINTFATQTGGTAGAANGFTRLGEVTPDDATTFNGSNVLNQEDLFNVTDSGIGSSDTVNAVQMGGRFRNNVADATTAVKFELEKTGSGTKSQSTAIVPNATAWNTNATAVPRLPVITLYKDPDGVNNWTQATLDSMQIGYLLSTGSTNRVDVTAVWVDVDYTPVAGPSSNVAYYAHQPSQPSSHYTKPIIEMY